MWLARVTDAPDGAQLAFAVYDADQGLIARPGDPVSEELRTRLVNEHYAEVVLLDEDETPIASASSEERGAVLGALDRARRYFMRAYALDARGRNTASATAEDELVTALTALARRQLGQRRLWLPGPVRTEERLRWLDEAVEGVMAAVFVGTKLGLADHTLVDLAHGMALRDIGLLGIPTEPLQRQGALTSNERQSVEKHAEIGFQLLQELEWADGAVRLVVQQHHERQDGSGYPFGVRGVHRVHRRPGERFNRDLMINLAEIAGVCDTFVALNSDRPHRPRLGADAVRLQLAQLSDGPLSAEVVDILLAFWTPPRDRCPAAGATPRLTALAPSAPQRGGPAEPDLLLNLVAAWRPPHGAPPDVPDETSTRIAMIVQTLRDQFAARGAGSVQRGAA